MRCRPKPNLRGFIPWQPSSWPEPPAVFDTAFVETLEKIIRETILVEIKNVISDAHKVNGNLEHRGHVVALAILCAVDSIAAYAFEGGVGVRYKKFISTFFPKDYQPFAANIYDFYRNSSVHSWNLFQAGIWPGNEPIRKMGSTLSFGLINFFEGLNQAVENFLSKLHKDPSLQQNSIKRYTVLKDSSIP